MDCGEAKFNLMEIHWGVKFMSLSFRVLKNNWGREIQRDSTNIRNNPRNYAEFTTTGILRATRRLHTKRWIIEFTGELWCSTRFKMMMIIPTRLTFVSNTEARRCCCGATISDDDPTATDWARLRVRTGTCGEFVGWTIVWLLTCERIFILHRLINLIIFFFFFFHFFSVHFPKNWFFSSPIAQQRMITRKRSPCE